MGFRDSPSRHRRVCNRGERIEGTSHAQHSARGLLHDMRVDHGGLHVRVPEQRLDGADVVAILQKVRGEAVPQHMAGDPSVDARRHGGGGDGLLHARLVHMPAAAAAADGIMTQAMGGEEVLPRQ